MIVYIFNFHIAVPLAAGVALRSWWVRKRGRDWFERNLLPRFAPITIAALLLTLIFLFAFQAENISSDFLDVSLIPIPLFLQVYFNSGLT